MLTGFQADCGDSAALPPATPTPHTAAAAIIHTLSLKRGKSGFRMSQQEAEINNRRNGEETVIPTFLSSFLSSSSPSFFLIHKRGTVNTVILPRVAPNDEAAQILSEPPAHQVLKDRPLTLLPAKPFAPNAKTPAVFLLLPSCH